MDTKQGEKLQTHPLTNLALTFYLGEKCICGHEFKEIKELYSVVWNPHKEGRISHERCFTRSSTLKEVIEIVDNFSFDSTYMEKGKPNAEKSAVSESAVETYKFELKQKITALLEKQ